MIAFAGTVLLAGLVLAQLTSPWWMLVPAFVGVNLLQASFNGFCPLPMILKAAGVKPGCAFQ